MDRSRLGDRVELHQFDRGYAGLGNVEGGEANLCMMATVETIRACGGRPDRLLTGRLRANPALAEVLEGAVRSSPWRSVGPLRFGVRRPEAAGALFVGDAAGTVDPFCGEGLAHALRGAELAVPFVLEAAGRGELTEELAAGYEEAWMSAFSRATRRVRWLGRLMQHPGIAGFALGGISRCGPWLFPRLVALSRTGRAASLFNFPAQTVSGPP
jgi:flavin-dependent dehydrogenase